MTPRQRFLNCVKMMPEKTQRAFAKDWHTNPTSFVYWYWEVKAKTEKGKQFLKEMGWEE